MAHPRARRRLLVSFGAALAVVAASLTGLANANAGSTGSPPAAKAASAGHGSSTKGAFDVRRPSTTSEKRLAATRSSQLKARPAVRALAATIGSQAVIDMDVVTGTPRQVGRLDGLLTAASTAAPSSIALGYVRAHLDAFGLSDADVAGLTLARDYVDIEGIHHLSYTQSAGGLTVFGNGLKANVAKDGRLISVSGSPLHAAQAPALAKGSLTGDQAIAKAKQDMNEKVTATGKLDTAKAVLFQTPGGLRRAWETVTLSAANPTLDVVDAASGRILYRDPLRDDFAAAPGDQSANVVDNYPGAPKGGSLRTVSLTANGWLPPSSVALFGNNVHTYADIDGDQSPDSNEEIAPTGSDGYRFPLVKTHPAGMPCDTSVCTWRPNVPFSWEANESRTATQNFYFINNWHDYLERAPIGFTEAAGNFQQVNASGHGLGGDPIHDEPLSGAAIDAGLPDGGHIDNADFLTPPDGTSPTMRMFLFHFPGTTWPDEDPFIAVAGSDTADVVYHEFTHGLSHRLVVDANNVPSLDSSQGGAMGEAWSDWYGLDYLVNQKLIPDTAKPDVIEGRYLDAGAFGGVGIRSEPIDCPVGSTAALCSGIPGAGPGGYTYGDFGTIWDLTGGDPHASGEIWMQTLWDLRTAVGPKVAESLVTRGMELSPTFPSMLDMRNAIIAADQAVNNGSHVKALWRAFAHRGMGFFAGTVDGNDTHPVESFSLPPTAGTAKGSLTGRVTNQLDGKPLSGVTVAFGGHNSGFPGDYATTTNNQGRYTISGVFVGTYPDVFAGGAGYNDDIAASLTIKKGTNTKNWVVVRDWAASAGGATIVDFSPPDYTDFGCGPAQFIDQQLGQGWGSDNTGPKFVIVKLPQAVDVETISIDPSNTCGDGPTAAAGPFKVETSSNGTTWHLAASGTFTAANLGRLNPLTPTGTTGANVSYVRYTMIAAQGADDFMDSTEMEVFGAPH